MHIKKKKKRYYFYISQIHSYMKHHIEYTWYWIVHGAYTIISFELALWRYKLFIRDSVSYNFFSYCVSVLNGLFVIRCVVKYDGNLQFFIFLLKIWFRNSMELNERRWFLCVHVFNHLINFNLIQNIELSNLDLKSHTSYTLQTVSK